MKTGRPRKPDEVHILEGTHRPDRHGEPTISIIAKGEPICPDNVHGKAREFWDSVVPGLIERGVAHECDSSALATMCRWHAVAEKLDNSLARMACTAKGYNQRLWAAAVAHDKWMRIAQAFGLDPASRSKLRQPANANKAEKVMSRKRG